VYPVFPSSPQDVQGPGASGHLEDPAAPQAGGGAVPGLAFPEEEVTDETFRQPVEDHDRPLEVSEICWCLRASAIWDIRYSFAPEGADRAYENRMLERLKEICFMRPPPDREAQMKAWTQLFGVGIRTARRTLDGMREKNPGLVRRGPLPPGVKERGRPNRATVWEAQVILNLLGFRAGAEDGVYGSNTRGTVRQFQEVLGLPVTGELDAATVSILRNCLFRPGDRPMTFKDEY
jgi:hypothetical protein